MKVIQSSSSPHADHSRTHTTGHVVDFLHLCHSQTCLSALNETHNFNCSLLHSVIQRENEISGPKWKRRHVFLLCLIQSDLLPFLLFLIWLVFMSLLCWLSWLKPRSERSWWLPLCVSKQTMRSWGTFRGQSSDYGQAVLLVGCWFGWVNWIRWQLKNPSD